MKRNVSYTQRARDIASIIKCVDTEERGLLLLEVSNELRGAGQNFTASLLKKAADRYGYPEQSTGNP